MSGDILHGTWLPSIQRFFVWGETAEPVRRKGRQPKVPPHPFQSSPDALHERLERLSMATADLDQQALSVWLPSVNGSPLPSPELIAAAGIDVPQEDLTLVSWQVSGYLLPAGRALDLLLAFTVNEHLAADLQTWRVAALLSARLMASQQILPVLVREGGQLRAAWQPRPDPATAQQIAGLARTLPPLCRAVVADPAAAPSSRELLDTFLAATIDATIREIVVELPASGDLTGWRMAQGIAGS